MDAATVKGSSSRPVGRPRSFDADSALDAAVLVFWEKGYDGTSLADLTSAMGINRPSLYATYGNKRELFIQVIDRYAVTYGGRAFSALKMEPGNRAAVQGFFDASIDCALADGTPRGCLINTVATEAAGTDSEIREKLARMFDRTDASMARRIAENQKAAGSEDCDPEQLARMAHSVTHSIMTRARAGASREDLAELAASFMRVLFPAT